MGDPVCEASKALGKADESHRVRFGGVAQLAELETLNLCKRGFESHHYRHFCVRVAQVVRAVLNDETWLYCLVRVCTLFDMYPNA